MTDRKPPAPPDLTEDERRARLRLLGVGPADESRLRELRAELGAEMSAALDRIFEGWLSFSEPRESSAAPAGAAPLKALGRECLPGLLDGECDAEYFAGRARVGAAIQRADVAPAAYLSGCASCLRLVVDLVMRRWGNEPAVAAAHLHAAIKRVFLDLGLVAEAYIASGYVSRSLAGEYQAAAERAESALRIKDEADQTRNDLTSMIVHDLKNPTGAIHSLAQMALRREPDAPQARAFRQILDRCADLLRMIQNLVEISKMEEGKLEVARSRFDAGGLLLECSAELEAMAEQSHQQIAVRVSPGTPPLLADRDLAKRVVTNLIVNSIRHSRATGVIELSAAEATRGEVRLAVSDCGQGIAPEHQEIIFEKFRTASRDGNRADTGLGLPFCRMAVERMGGRIWVESALGKGCCFYVTLPAET